MHSTIDTGMTTAGGALKAFHLSSVGVAALAVAAVVGLGAVDKEGRPAPGASPSFGQQSEFGHAGPDRVLAYLVGTEAEKQALEDEVVISPEWFVETYAATDTRVRIVVLDHTEEESLATLARLVPETSISTGHGLAIKLVDMR